MIPSLAESGACGGIELQAADEHRFALLHCPASSVRATLLWLPALGVAARHYMPFAEALAARGVSVFVHEWRGHGSSSVRASRALSWGYRTLLVQDLPVSLGAAFGGRAHDSIRSESGQPGSGQPSSGQPSSGRLYAGQPDSSQSKPAHSEHSPNTMPRIVGGHSLGGQLATLALALDPDVADRLWLAASGAPYWRSFPGPRGWMLPWAYRFLWWLAEARGALPGRAIGFGGREARGVMRDWARSGLSGRYAADGLSVDLESALSALHAPVDAVRLSEDWLVPEGSLHHLTGKMPRSTLHATVIDRDMLGVGADHFTWLRHPDAVATAFMRSAGLDTGLDARDAERRQQATAQSA